MADFAREIREHRRSSTVGKIWERFRDVSESAILIDLHQYEQIRYLYEQDRSPGQSFGSYIRDFYIPQRWADFEENFFREAVVEHEKLVVYRCLEHPRPDLLLRKIVSGRGDAYKGRLGVYWTFMRSAAQCYWGSGTLPELYLTGLADPSSIDVKRTVFANFNPDVGLDEAEIRLKEGAPVVIVEACFRKDRRVSASDAPCRQIDWVTRKA